MPVGRTEDHIVEGYKEGLAEASTKEEREKVWEKYRESMEKALQQGTTIVDMGMDLAN
jgi:hypothetical protein